MKSRDLSIEYIRIIACLFVVMIHIQPPGLIIDGDIQKESLLIACMIGDAVGLFFAITGAFWFKEQPYIKVINKHIRNVILPSLLGVVIIMSVLTYVHTSDVTIHMSDLSIPRFDALLKGLLFFNMQFWGDTFNHYWYLFSFFELLIWYPILNLICKPENEKTIMWLIGITFVALLITDFQKVNIIDPGYKTFYTLPLYAIEMLLGYELYRKKQWFKKNRLLTRIGSICLLIVTLIYRFYMEMSVLRVDESDRTFLFADRSISFLIIISIFSFFLSLDTVKNKCFEKIILWFSTSTFYIYIVHMAVKMKLDNLGIYWKLHNFIMGLRIGHGKYVLFSLLMTSVVVICSLPFAIILKYISKYVQLIWDKMMEGLSSVIKERIKR